MRSRRKPRRKWRRAVALSILLGAASLPGAAAVAGPRLLFTPEDIPALRAKIADGGDDERAYAAILQRWPGYQTAPDESLLAGTMEGTIVLSELGLMAHLESPGTAQGQRGRELLLHVTRTREVDTYEFGSALRLRTLAFGYDMVMEGATPAEQAEVRSEIRTYLNFMPQSYVFNRYLYNPYTSNKAMMIGSAMGLAVISIWDDVPPAEQPALLAALEFADQLVTKCRDDILASDGAYREGVLYGAWTMRMAIPYFEARRRFDGADLAADPRIERMAAWLSYEVLPEGGGRENNLGANSWMVHSLAGHSTYLDWAQTRYSSGLARWLYRHTAGEFGWDAGEVADRTATVLWSRSLPTPDPASLLPHGALFPGRGIYFYRSAWKSGATGDEILFSFQAGRYYGGHAQEDQGQFTLYAHGDRFVVDNGAANPTQLPKDTQSHNLILIDGVGQHNAGASIGTDARFTNTLLSPFCDYVHADLDSAYETHSPFNNPEHPFPGTDWSWGYDGGTALLRADRSVAVIKGAEAPTWFFLADDFQKDNVEHTYEWLLHTDSTNTVDLASDPVTIHGVRSRMLVWFAHPRPPALDLSVAPWLNGGEDPTTVRLVARMQAVEGRFVVALVPLPDLVAPPAASLAQLGRVTGVRLDWGEVEDVAVFNPADSLSAISDVETDGRMAVVRLGAGNIVSYLLAEGSILRHASLDLLAFSGGNASGALSGSDLHLSRGDLDFVAYGPKVTRVLGPQGELRYVRQGDWVRSPAVASAASPGRVPATTAIRLDCAPHPSSVRASIYDVRGRLLRSLDRRALDGDGRTLLWDRVTAGGRRVAAGVYFVHVRACGVESRRRMVVLP